MDKQSLWLAGAIQQRKVEIQNQIAAETLSYEAAMERYRVATNDLLLEQEYGPTAKK